MPQPLQIRLGPHWTKFSRARDDLTLIGTVQQYAAIGALAVRPDGRYVQINGDIEQLLNTSRVEKALRGARARPGQDGGSRPRPQGASPRRFDAPRPVQSDPAEANDPPPVHSAPTPKQPVVVSIKRRRVPVVQSN